MSVTLQVNHGGSTPLPIDEDEAASVCQAVLEHEGVTKSCVVSLTLVSDEEMRELNSEWRGVDSATDVLSFEMDKPDDPEIPADEPCELGDIVLACDYVTRQAGTFETTPADETRLLLVHGMLHLLGLDHVEEGEALAMQGLEDDIIGSLATDGTLGPVTLTRHREEGHA